MEYLSAGGSGLEKIVQWACELYEIGREELYEEGQQQWVEDWSLAIYWAVWELG